MKINPAIGPPQSSEAQRFVPRDTESFIEAQRHNRHATWQLAVASILATIVMGIPVALTITPLLYAAGLLFADILNIWVPVPSAVWQHADELARYGFLVIGWLTQGTAADSQALAIGAMVLLLPGVALSVGLWIAVSALFKRAGVGGALLALKAREPNPLELKELQLSDVVQEMAIAAGLPAPRIMLIDATAANAACIGTSPKDARIVVSRGLVERLNRDELEGALAHLIASIGNGDLRIAFRVTSVFETYGLLVALINSPFGSQSRSTLWRILRYAFAGRKSGDGAEEAEAVAQLLTRGAGLETDDIDRMFDTNTKKSVLRSIRNFLLFPIFFTNLAIKLSLWFFSFSMLQPSVALLWRKRKYLADACAVQLTRNPDGLAEALRKLNTNRGPIPGGAWASNLFLVSPAGSDRVSDPTADAEQLQMLARMWASSASGDGRDMPPNASPVHANRLFMGEILATGRAAMTGDQNALRRMTAFRHAAAAALGQPVENLPDLSDFAAAQRGDMSALKRLMEFSSKYRVTQPLANDSGDTSEDLNNFAGFFPSLKRRLKRLDKMGAHVELDTRRFNFGSVVFIALLAVFLAPFALLAAALLLLLIAILTMASLVFISVWMAFIHELFGVLLHH